MPGSGSAPALELPGVIGHRGAAAHAPENTLAGIRRAAEIGVPWVEFDTKITADGRCIVFHDDVLDRTTDGRGPVARASWGEIGGLDAGSWFGEGFAGETVPRLDSALALVVELGLHADIEIKPSPGREADTAAAVIAEAVACWPADLPPPLITSFTPECLAVVRARAPSWPRGLICFRYPRGWRAKLETLDCRAFVCRHDHLTRRRVSLATAAGVAVLAFTVNDARRAAALLEWGVATIISDAPDLMLPILRDRAAAGGRAALPAG